MRVRIAVAAAAGCLMLAFAPSAAIGHGTHLKANMTGEQVVGAEGAPNGEGKARMHVLKGKRKLCYRLRWSGIGGIRGVDVAVYSGRAGENGNELVPLEDPDNLNRKGMRGCEKTSKRHLRELNRSPHLYHVNVKNRKYPTDGAIRGQLKS